MSDEPPSEIPEVKTTGLPGTWLPEEIGGVAAVAGVLSSVSFTADGRIRGHGGVNRFGGPWRLSGDELELGPFFSTRMAGPEDAMAHEAALLAALEGTHPYSLQDDVLVIGAEPDTLRLRRQPDDPFGAEPGAA